MPAPFLNRFEKYRITYTNILESALQKLPHGWKSLMNAAVKKVHIYISYHFFTCVFTLNMLSRCTILVYFNVHIYTCQQVSEFAKTVEKSSSLYGYEEETISSLLLLLLPAQAKFLEHTCSWVNHSTEPDQFLLESVVNLMKDIGFHIPHVSFDIIMYAIFILHIQSFYYASYVGEQTICTLFVYCLVCLI